jgi:hypothetical protein
MAPDETQLRAAARRAYEWGRAWHALRWGLVVLPLLLCSLAGCGQPQVTAVTAAALFGLVFTLKWRGGSWGGLVLPSLAAGVVPLSFPLLARFVGHLCSAGTTSQFVWVCALSGAACGFWVGARAARDERRGPGLLALSALVAALTGALGCIAAGASGLLGMSAGIVLGVTPGLVRARRA